MELPTNSQKLAADPKISVKVTANAGTGKTRVLTNRVLRLLLDGVHPGKILCLTYTKAAAAEMVSRISTVLEEWAISDNKAVAEAIYKLVGIHPDDSQIKQAKTLFARTIESTPPPRIQTIHSFCQEVLKRFPLESGIPPYFNVIDEISTREIIEEAKHKILLHNGDAVKYFGTKSSEWKFKKIVSEIIRNRNHISELITSHQGKQGLLNKIYSGLGVLGQTEKSLIDKFFNESTPSFVKGTDLQQAYDESDFALVIKKYLTDKKTPRASVIKGAKDDLKERIIMEQGRVLATYENILKIRTADFTKYTVELADEFASIYKEIKQEKAVLDYDDLIHHTKELLTSKDSTAWVLYKLDGGIDHILVDEAQDTSPEQWYIINALVDDFFSGEAGRDQERTLFIVGDEKQSIYGFQGADPEKFAEVTKFISEKCIAAQKTWQELPLKKSFRSVEAVLSLVDQIFSNDEYRKAVTSSEFKISHELHRVGEGGKAEIWPLYEDDKEQEVTYWPLPNNPNSYKNAETKMAEDIAKTIDSWLNKEERVLVSKGRKVEPKDIIILLRSRGELADLIVKNLKRKSIPVSGADRLKITDHIAIQDLIALTNFLLLPSDDLSLAGVLKSPLFGVSEQGLFELAYGRESSLYNSIRSNKNYSALADELETLLNKSDFVPIYEFYSFILDELGGRKKFNSRLGSEVNDVLNEFLELCLKFETEHTSSLQSFIHWLTQSEMEIKRDLEHGAGQVRVMTVHGSKGLQAPIVIMADSNSVPRPEEDIYFTDSAILVSKSAEDKCEELRTLSELMKKNAYNEYLRLLYVAATRAEDELYILGSESKQSGLGKSWYEICNLALRQIGQEMDDGRVVLETAQANQIEAESGKSNKITNHILPEYINRTLATERIEFEDLRDDIVDKKIDKIKNQRGKRIHKILEIIGNIPAEQREQKLAEIGDKEIADKVRILLNDQKTSKLFSSEALSEVPLIGRIGDRIISARIDKLVVTADEVLIVDFKTSENPPKSMPEAYISQLSVYAELLALKYPNRRIRAGILWTETARFDEVGLTSGGSNNISGLRVTM